MSPTKIPPSKSIPTSTVGRGKTISISPSHLSVEAWSNDFVSISQGDSLDFYASWDSPTVIVSDGVWCQKSADIQLK